MKKINIKCDSLLIQIQNEIDTIHQEIENLQKHKKLALDSIQNENQYILSQSELKWQEREINNERKDLNIIGIGMFLLIVIYFLYFQFKGNFNKEKKQHKL